MRKTKEKIITGEKRKEHRTKKNSSQVHIFSTLHNCDDVHAAKSVSVSSHVNMSESKPVHAHAGALKYTDYLPYLSPNHHHCHPFHNYTAHVYRLNEHLNGTYYI